VRRKLPNLKLGVHDFNSKAGKDKNAARIVNIKDGILSPRFRLPTEAEWEYAALAFKTTQNFNRSHPDRMDLSNVENKLNRINNRKRRSRRVR
jgi:formylglycine-generating enzyme required for sulfatase activity